MSENFLSIRARALNLDLTGEPEYIERAYDAIRGVLMERFVESVEAEPATDEAGLKRKTMPLHAVTPDSDAEPEADEPDADDDVQHVNVVLCNEVYHKIHLADADDLRASIFSRTIDMSNVGRIFLNRSQREAFGALLEDSELLWRELTSEGKKAVKGSGK